MIRFKEIGVQSNFVSLLMGPPGVGKSQWITQLGRESGRNIYNVDLGKVKDAYVGESEKNILSIFQYYNQQVERVVNRGGDKDGNRIPILVINECEVLMNNRTMFERKTSVENMLQSIVNLLLLKLEELKGIVIMTTNTDNPHNIDPAFSRRINYKFLIPKPSAQVRGRIIHSVLGEWFSENDCSVLGEKYDLTGGLVKNIHQKVVSHYVLQGSIPSIETLHGWCDNESKGFGLMNSKSSIGFNSQ